LGAVLTAHGSLDFKQEIQIQIQMMQNYGFKNTFNAKQSSQTL
jgi:hypothetical protein